MLKRDSFSKVYFHLSLAFFTLILAFFCTRAWAGEEYNFWGYNSQKTESEEKARYTEWQRWQKVISLKDDENIEDIFKLMPKIKAEQWLNVKNTYKLETNSTEKLRLISGFFNSWNSYTDMDLYGKKEYWASPREFIENKGGDCEDFAIIKYTALKKLGWPKEDMCLCLVYDKHREINHAVLAVKDEKDTYILDNLSVPRNLILKKDIYLPIYLPKALINENGIWTFPENKEDAK